MSVKPRVVISSSTEHWIISISTDELQRTYRNNSSHDGDEMGKSEYFGVSFVESDVQLDDMLHVLIDFLLRQFDADRTHNSCQIL